LVRFFRQLFFNFKKIGFFPIFQRSASQIYLQKTEKKTTTKNKQKQNKKNA